MNGLHVFIEMKQKKNSKWQTQKNSFSSSTRSQYFFMKMSWIGPWVSRIDYAKGIGVAQPIIWL